MLRSTACVCVVCSIAGVTPLTLTMMGTGCACARTFVPMMLGRMPTRTRWAELGYVCVYKSEIECLYVGQGRCPGVLVFWDTFAFRYIFARIEFGPLFNRSVELTTLVLLTPRTTSIAMVGMNKFTVSIAQGNNASVQVSIA